MNSDMHVAGQLTALGWTTCALYLIAAGLAFRTAWVCRSQGAAALGRSWNGLAAALSVLGLNKPLDLQTRLIKLGRLIARQENLVAYRAELHALFFLGFILVIIAIIAVAGFRRPAEIRNFIRQQSLAAGGCALIGTYILIRAISISRVDQGLGFDLERIPGLWLLEAGGLGIIMLAALRAKNQG